MEYHQNETAKCTLCGEIEDDDHLFQCKEVIMRDAQEETITNMCSSLQKINTSPYIIKTIKTHLKHWMAGKNSPSQTHLHSNNDHHQEIIKAIRLQDKLGWTHLI